MWFPVAASRCNKFRRSKRYIPSTPEGDGVSKYSFIFSHFIFLQYISDTWDYKSTVTMKSQQFKVKVGSL